MAATRQPRTSREAFPPPLRFLIVAAAASAAGAVGGLIAILLAELLVHTGHGSGLTPIVAWFILVVAFGAAGASLAIRWLRRSAPR